MALREQLRGQQTISAPRDGLAEFLCEAALGLPDARAADFIANSLTYLYFRDRNQMPYYVHHVARYGSESGADRLTTFLQTRTESYARTGFALLVAAARGWQERGGPVPAEFSKWAMDRCAALLASAKIDDVRDGIALAIALNQPAAHANVATVLDDRMHPLELRLAALKGLATVGAS